MPDTTKSDPTPTHAIDPPGVPSAPATFPGAARQAGRRGEDAIPADQGLEVESAVSRSPARWWLTVVVGGVASLPFAWLLSYAALLPFYLGLFFFLLFGLVIGAVMHRVASPNRPYGQTALLIGTTIVVAVCWGTSIVKESRDFPSDMASDAGNRTRDIGDRSIEEYRAAVAGEIRGFLCDKYPPGGVIGYMRWILTSGELRKGQIEDVSRTLRRSQRGYWWAIRVVLSAALLGFGIVSQTFLLRLAVDPAVRMIDEKKDGAPS